LQKDICIVDLQNRRCTVTHFPVMQVITWFSFETLLLALRQVYNSCAGCIKRYRALNDENTQE
jgi:hypothetical protein